MLMLIGGDRAGATDGRTIDVINPATMQVIDTVPAATKEDVERAVSYAREGYLKWSKVPLYERIETIHRFKELYLQHLDELTELMQAETGKLLNFARDEVDGVPDSIDAYLEYARILGGDSIPAGNRKGMENNLVITVREPLGVVAGIVPFNYPVGTLAQKAIPALLMGNAVIIKPSTETPLANIRFAELLIESGIPAKAVQLVTGKGSDIGEYLINNEKIDAVTLTGSTQVGIEVAKNSAHHLHIIGMELGGNDSLIILSDASLDRAVNESIEGRLGNSGQTCCASKRFLVHNSIKKEYIDRLVSMLKTKKVGNPLELDTDCGPVISLKAAREIEDQINIAVKQGAVLHLGGKRFNHTYIKPTVLEVRPEHDIAQNTEVFGPVWSVIGFDDVDEAIDIANNTKYGLSSGVIGKDIQQMLYVAKSVQAGACILNGSGNYGSLDQPFGGYKQSGLGREGGKYSLEAMSQLKTLIFKEMF